MANMANIVAYIDPNTGGMVFQIIAAGIALLSGVVLVFARQIRTAAARIGRWIRERLHHDTSQD